MIEALWSVEFVSNSNITGAGVAVFETGRILGGDGNYFYIGSYQIVNGQVAADIKVTHYSGIPHSVFGHLQQFDLSLTGTIAHAKFLVAGNLVQNPNQKIVIQLTRRAELP